MRVVRRASQLVMHSASRNAREPPEGAEAGQPEGRRRGGQQQHRCPNNGRGEGEGGAGGRVCIAHCTHSACTDRGGRRRTEGRDGAPGGRTPHGQVQGVTSGAGQGVPRIVSRVVPVAINWPEGLHGRWAYSGASPLSCCRSPLLPTMVPVKVCGSRLVPWSSSFMA